MQRAGEVKLDIGESTPNKFFASACTPVPCLNIRMFQAGTILCIGLLIRNSLCLPTSPKALTLKDYLGEYFFGGNRQSGSILVTEAGKTKSGAKYNAPYTDLHDFAKIVKQDDLKDALWVWLPGRNQYNGEGWYHHDTIYKLHMKSPSEMIGYTGDMQRNANGTPSKNQGKAAMTITLQDNSLVMNLGGGFGHESWVHFLPDSIEN